MRRSIWDLPAWIPVAWLATVANVVATWFAARPGEPTHAMIHALLAGGFAMAAQRLTARRELRALNQQLQEVLDQNERLELSAEEMQTQLSEMQNRAEFAERRLSAEPRRDL